MRDDYNRSIEYMRISITDRCNLRCRYCMPAHGVEKISMSGILTFEEIAAICRQAVALGINRFKITGGEPLVRRGCVDLITMIKSIPGVDQVTLTTNGQLLGKHVEELAEAGVDGINVSLDSLKEDRYRMITRGGELEPVLGSIDRAILLGLKVKTNCLIQKDFNEDEVVDFADMAFDKGIDVRFIETMPVGFANATEGVSNEEVLDILMRRWPMLSPDKRIHGNGPAIYYRLPDRAGALGLISAVHQRFCQRCNRIRLTSTGQLRPCLCYDDSIDLKPILERGDDEGLREALSEAVRMKPESHCFENRRRVEEDGRGEAYGKAMVEIGG